MKSPQTSQNPEQLTRAYVAPFVVFMGFMILLQIIGGAIEWKHPDAPWWRQDPAQFVYPIQTLVTLGVLIRYWRWFAFNWSLKWGLVGIAFGAVGIGFWLLPTALYDAWGMQGPAQGVLKLLGFAERREGFDPGLFENPIAYWAALVLRFLRAAMVVALVEEIFWRGFMMRFVCDWEGDYWKQPFGRPRWISYLIVTGLFMAAHAPVDYAGAFIYGSLTYLLCVWSKSLGACVIMHGTANFLMGLYIMATGHYGLW
jgi:CAAX prenyl protease-like protein